jgi:hypothetical protein
MHLKIIYWPRRVAVGVVTGGVNAYFSFILSSCEPTLSSQLANQIRLGSRRVSSVSASQVCEFNMRPGTDISGNHSGIGFNSIYHRANVDTNELIHYIVTRNAHKLSIVLPQNTRVFSLIISPTGWDITRHFFPQYPPIETHLPQEMVTQIAKQSHPIALIEVRPTTQFSTIFSPEWPLQFSEDVRNKLLVFGTLSANGTSMMVFPTWTNQEALFRFRTFISISGLFPSFNVVFIPRVPMIPYVIPIFPNSPSTIDHLISRRPFREFHGLAQSPFPYIRILTPAMCHILNAMTEFEDMALKEPSRRLAQVWGSSLQSIEESLIDANANRSRHHRWVSSLENVGELLRFWISQRALIPAGLARDQFKSELFNFLNANTKYPLDPKDWSVCTFQSGMHTSAAMMAVARQVPSVSSWHFFGDRSPYWEVSLLARYFSGAGAITQLGESINFHRLPKNVGIFLLLDERQAATNDLTDYHPKRTITILKQAVQFYRNSQIIVAIDTSIGGIKTRRLNDIVAALPADLNRSNITLFVWNSLQKEHGLGQDMFQLGMLMGWRISPPIRDHLYELSDRGTSPIDQSGFEFLFRHTASSIRTYNNQILKNASILNDFIKAEIDQLSHPLFRLVPSTHQLPYVVLQCQVSSDTEWGVEFDRMASFARTTGLVERAGWGFPYATISIIPRNETNRFSFRISPGLETTDRLRQISEKGASLLKNVVVPG